MPSTSFPSREDASTGRLSRFEILWSCGSARRTFPERPVGGATGLLKCHETWSLGGRKKFSCRETLNLPPFTVVKHRSLPRTETAIVCRFTWALLPIVVLLTSTTPLPAQKPVPATKPLPAEKRAPAEKSGNASSEKYLLRYALQSGEVIRYEVTHVAKTKTRIRGIEEISQVHTTSQRHWDVTGTDDHGMTFNHVIDSVEMTQQQGDGEEIRWSSASEEEPPEIFERVAEQIGETLSTITVNQRGQETERKDDAGTKAKLGMGSLTLPLPENAIAIGDSWSVPREVKTRTDDNQIKVIKIRELYKLVKVKTGVATLSLRSEPLTPMDDESVRAQVIQQLSNGKIRFDIDNGRMLSKQLDWDETVIGFQGADSLMEYRARLTEKLVDGIQRTAKRPR